jgi:hypothetical protein
MLWPVVLTTGSILGLNYKASKDLEKPAVRGTGATGNKGFVFGMGIALGICVGVQLSRSKYFKWLELWPSEEVKRGREISEDTDEEEMEEEKPAKSGKQSKRK